MKGVLIAWTLPGADKTTSSFLAKMLYGQETSSCGRRYVYRRKGYLDDIPYVKLIRGSFIVLERDSRRVMEFLLYHGAKLYVRNVTLTQHDKRRLKKKD